MQGCALDAIILYLYNIIYIHVNYPPSNKCIRAQLTTDPTVFGQRLYGQPSVDNTAVSSCSYAYKYNVIICLVPTV